MNFPPNPNQPHSPMHRSDRTFCNIPGDPKLGLQINLPAALKGREIHGLPPYAKTSAYLVDDYELCPASWPRSKGLTASYFVGVKENHGMWLDFNRVFAHDHHVAVVVSIQGINPLTGRRTDKLEMERYPDSDAVEEEWLRGYQNYLATSSTPNGLMWIDGFRSKDGIVRQYVFTKDESKGVAAQLIGEDRVFAIGAAFFVSKEPKPPGERRSWPGVSPYLIDHSFWPSSQPHDSVTYGSSLKGIGKISAQARTAYRSFNADNASFLCSASNEAPLSMGEMQSLAGDFGAVGHSGPEGVDGLHDESLDAAVVSDRLEISAGEQIDQQLWRDHNPLDFWLPEPAGVVVVNYAPQSLVKRILAGAKAKVKEGFLDQVPVGNGD